MSTILLAFPQETLKPTEPNAFTSDNVAEANTIGEIWNGSEFDYVNLNTLLKYVSGSDNVSTKDLSILNGNQDITDLKGITAEQMRASTAAGKEEGKDIVVTFGDLTWTPTYLSKDKSGNLILTLWLSDSAQLEGKTYDPTRDPFDASGSAKWNAGGDANDKPTDNYPDAMYGTSYMNAVVLNNGGYYKPTYSKDEVTKVEKNPNHIFAKFTTDEKLTKYIATPSEVAWQEFGQDKRLYNNYTLPNENWSETINKNGTIEGDPTGTSYNFKDNYNYAPKEHSDQWKNSTLWLPSMSETGYSDSKVGIWETSTAQRSNTYYSWLRSGHYFSASSAYRLTSAGSDISVNNMYISHAVRPALHLNLTKAVQPPTLADTTAEFDQNDPTNEAFKDIYKITNPDGSIDFHIKTAEGFLKLSEATAAGSAFDPKWTFYLDNDITLTGYIGIISNFTGTLDGQGHKLVLSNLKCQEFAPHLDIFQSPGNCNIQNLIIEINYDEINMAIMFYLFYEMSSNSSVVNLAHVTITGNIQCIFGFNYVGSGDTGNYTFNLYDVNVIPQKAPAMMIFTGSNKSNLNLNMDSCRFIYKTSESPSLLNFSNTCNVVTMHNTYIDWAVSNSVKLFLFNKSVVCYECQFNLSIAAGNASVFSGEPSTCEFYDTVFIGTEITSLFSESNYPSSGEYYYSGLYLHDTTTGATTIVDPDFTNSKWCADPHLNGGLPQLRRFVSIGDFLEQCDMQTWTSEILKQQNAA